VEQEIEAGNIDPGKLACTVKERFAKGEFTITVNTVSTSDNVEYH
jgi:hypothetical protein